MSRHRRAGLCSALLAACACLCACLSACESSAPLSDRAAGTPDASRAGENPVRDFEQHQRDRATLLERQGRLPEAAASWEVLAVLNPRLYRERLADLRQRMAAQAEDTLARARQEAKDGHAEAAEQWYLSTLALQPDQREAMEALRAIDKARIRRDYLAKPARIVAPRPDGRSANAGSATADASSLLELEHASDLANQGGVDEAIELIERRVRKNPRDEPARSLLANLYFQRAKSLQSSDVPGALTALRRCLQLDARHAAALALRARLTASSPAPSLVPTPDVEPRARR